MNEVDLIIHYMRQSKMDAVRSGLEELIKARDAKPENSMRSLKASTAIEGIKALFKQASNNAPIP